MQFKPEKGKLVGCGYIHGEVFFTRSMTGAEAHAVPRELTRSGHRVYVDSADYGVSGALNPVISLYNVASAELLVTTGEGSFII